MHMEFMPLRIDLQHDSHDMRYIWINMSIETFNLEKKKGSENLLRATH
jgi:hypothetical protein